MIPSLQPLPLTRRPEPFSHPDWLYDKYGGFRALAYCDPSGVRLISREGNRLSSFTELCAGIEFALKARHAVLDGEIVCLDQDGCSHFNQLLAEGSYIDRAEPVVFMGDEQLWTVAAYSSA